MHAVTWRSRRVVAPPTGLPSSLPERNLRRHQGPRSEVEIIAQIARETLPVGSPASGALDWQSMESTGKIREAIAKVVSPLDHLPRHV